MILLVYHREIVTVGEKTVIGIVSICQSSPFRHPCSERVIHARECRTCGHLPPPLHVWPLYRYGIWALAATSRVLRRDEDDLGPSVISSSVLPLVSGNTGGGELFRVVLRNVAALWIDYIVTVIPIINIYNQMVLSPLTHIFSLNIILYLNLNT